MNILIEGPDGSGKSTLAKYLSHKTNRRIVHSTGPEQYAHELNDRAAAFLAQDRVIFDRHPCVSERIYHVLRGPCLIDTALVNKLYDQKPLIVYCHAEFRHQPREGENARHLKDIETNRVLIRQRYAAWALEHAHIIHRGGVEQTTQMILGAMV